jgi:hypothetical protein
MRQDPGHFFNPGEGRSYQVGDLTNPNLKPWAKELIKRDIPTLPLKTHQYGISVEAETKLPHRRRGGRRD